MSSNPAAGLLARLGGLVSRHRRLVAALLAGAAMACALAALRPPEPARVDVLAAAGDLAGGAQLTETDVTTLRLRPAVVPEGTLRPPADVTGRMLAAPMRAGETLTDAAFAGKALLARGDLVATPVRIADVGVARMLRPGARVDILAASVQGDPPGEAARLVAPDVRVVAVPDPQGSGRPAPGEGALVMVAATPEEASELAAAAVTSRLSVALRPG